MSESSSSIGHGSGTQHDSKTKGQIHTEGRVGAGAWTDHRILRRLIEAVSWVTWREVAIDDMDAVATGPVLLVANHFGGISDAIVLMSVLPRRPRILADDQIWKVPIVRSAMNSAGGIPVHRGNSGRTDNTDMFAAAHKALERGEIVLIFPEGITREEPSIGRVRSGAARIAIGARSQGVKGIRIVPVGIHYDDKAAFRSAVFVREGEPIDVDAEVALLGEGGDGGEDPMASDNNDRRATTELTSLIEQRLRSSAPDYDDWREARALQVGAESFLRSLEPDRPVAVSLRDRLASWLAARDIPAVTDAADIYRTELDHLGVTDSWAAEGHKLLNFKRLLMAAAWVLLLPYAVIGAVAWAIPATLTWMISKIRMAPAVMATVMPIVVILLFGAMTGFWFWFGWNSNRLSGVVTAALVLPISFAAAALLTERAALWFRWSTNRMRTVGGRGRQLAESRARVVALIAEEVSKGLAGPSLQPGNIGHPEDSEISPPGATPMKARRNEGE
ncbi:MAG TPA: 1-acyl-sn-glycerol-3-phosphate acyltransferase [Microthrixaceae bacterium]|nr:1-acyl-sn-glycerol-3-phosphate acyltransferase [Microthrixaceae bacterium]